MVLECSEPVVKLTAIMLSQQCVLLHADHSLCCIARIYLRNIMVTLFLVSSFGTPPSFLARSHIFVQNMWLRYTAALASTAVHQSY